MSTGQPASHILLLQYRMLISNFKFLILNDEEIIDSYLIHFDIQRKRSLIFKETQNMYEIFDLSKVSFKIFLISKYLSCRKSEKLSNLVQKLKITSWTISKSVISTWKSLKTIRVAISYKYYVNVNVFQPKPVFWVKSKWAHFMQIFCEFIYNRQFTVPSYYSK